MKRWGLGRGITLKTSSNLHDPLLLEALSNDETPTLLVSAKSDSPRGSWEVDNDMLGELCSTVSGIESFPVSLSSPETYKRCISIILRKVVLKRRGELLPSHAGVIPHIWFDMNWHEMIPCGLTNHVKRIPTIKEPLTTSCSDRHTYYDYRRDHSLFTSSSCEEQAWPSCF